MINQAAARSLLDIIRYRPGRSAGKIVPPFLVCISKDDSVAPPALAEHYARQAPRSTVKSTSEIPCAPIARASAVVGERWTLVILRELAMGNRQIDGAIAAVDALPGIVDAVDGRVKVLVDSGIRSGSDVFKALALGADAACIGRPHMYGLALAGSAGVADVVANIIAEFDLVLALSGHASVAEVGRDSLHQGH